MKLRAWVRKNRKLIDSAYRYEGWTLVLNDERRKEFVENHEDLYAQALTDGVTGEKEE